MPITQSAVARVVGVDTQYKNLSANAAVMLAQRVALIGQGSASVSYPTVPEQVTSAVAVGAKYGYGSPLHLAALELFPVNGDGVGSIPVTLYPLAEDGSAVASDGEINIVGTASKTAEFRVSAGGVQSAIAVVVDGDDPTDIDAKLVAAINAEPSSPVIATSGTAGQVLLESKWAGQSANNIPVSVDGPNDAGVTFSVVAMSGGAANPDIEAAFALIGDVWETAIINCANYDDTTTLGAINTWGEGRWSPLVKKPAFAVTGTNETDIATIETVTDARKTDRVNVLVSAPGSASMPHQIAARTVARIVTRADENPARSYAGLTLGTLDNGAAGSQFDYLERDRAVKSGISTTSERSGRLTIEDVVTMYRPDGDPLPAYRKLATVVKLQNIVFNLNLAFSADEWDGAVLIPDGQPTTNAFARTPRSALLVVNGLADSLANAAIISDAESTKDSATAGIDAQNPDRLNVAATFKVSGNAENISVENNWGFYFGGVN